jgi:predicted transcriptional regulator
MDRTLLLEHTAKIVSAYVSNNAVTSSELPGLIDSVFTQLAALTSAAPPVRKPQEPAINITNSVMPDYIVCLEDGKKLKMLKRYLRTHFDMSPDEYRVKWSLAPDYPMVAPNYAVVRSEHAKEIGLGKKKKSEL